MSENLHARALELIAKARIEGLAESDRTWLAAHTQDCDSCAEHARQTDRALRMLRTVAVPVPPNLVSRTQFRVRLHAQQLQETEPRRRVLWLISAMSWALGIASAPYVWQVFAWIGHRTGTPKLVWEIGFGLWWTIPAVYAVMVLLLENARLSNASDWRKRGD
jgi:predicted anti-sigma-YlaC factor YlaD